MHLTRRSDRPDATQRKLRSGLEALEHRELLSTATTSHPFSPWKPTDLPVYTAPAHQPEAFSIHGLVNQARQNPQAQFVNNEGKVVSGEDRQGDVWTITVHGPGAVIVSDTTPNDGMLDDNIATIQLIGTDPNNTYVTGSTQASAFTPTDGTVLFNKLIDTSGVKSVVLNGFTLTQTVPPPTGQANYSNSGIFLTGGVGLLQFHDIIGVFDQATSNAPINIVIGDTSSNLTVAPTIRLDSIFNTVFNSNAATVPTNPQIDPTVQIIVNGQLRSLDIVSSTQHPYADPAQVFRGTPEVIDRTTSSTRYSNPTLSPIASAGNQFQFPIVGTTGRTAVRALGINHLNARGNVVNVTASKGATPFQNSLSGLDHLSRVHIGGNADALGLDVSGKIGKLRFDRGLGNPAGTSNAATDLGIPAGQTGFPAAHLQGGLVTATQIGRIDVGPANHVLQTSTNPRFVVLNSIGNPTYFPRPGNALTSSTIVSGGSIGSVNVVGNTAYSEIKTGFDYPSYAAGLQGTRGKSKIARFRGQTDMVTGVVSASYRPGDLNTYGSATDVAGPGKIVGKSRSHLYINGGTTPLGNHGAGFFARRKGGGYLPPPSLPTRVDSRLVR